MIVALSKSGCCYHKTEKYNITSNKPVMIEQIIEDATSLENHQIVTKKNESTANGSRQFKKRSYKTIDLKFLQTISKNDAMAELKLPEGTIVTRSEDEQLHVPSGKINFYSIL